jgi:formylglycine-generating enzyme required for sulfatase activity
MALRKKMLPLAAIAAGLIAGTGLLAIASSLRTSWPLDLRVAEGPISDAQRRLAFDGIRVNGDWDPVLRRRGGLDMALVPAGCFRMGSTDAELAIALDSCDRFYGRGGCPHDFPAAEQPVHEVCFARPFWLGRTEVTNREYGSSSSTDASAMFRGPDWPRESVTWQEAQDFCLGRRLRLPTEAEWEYAARGPDGLIFPWGNEFDLAKVVSGRLSPENVGFHEDVVSWVGAYDLSGGIAEWMADGNGANPFEIPADPRRSAADEPRAVRGGSWFSFAAFMLRAAQREAFDPGYRSSVVGFRCGADFE